MKYLVLFICLSIPVGAAAQRRGIDPGEKQFRIQDFKSLKLTPAQRGRIADLIRKERLQHWKDMQELDKILTEDQKKKLAKWRGTVKAPADSTSNLKNNSHD
jgi:Spy/CpxP family protein refolding chaperone